MGSLGHVDVE